MRGRCLVAAVAVGGGWHSVAVRLVGLTLTVLLLTVGVLRTLTVGLLGTVCRCRLGAVRRGRWGAVRRGRLNAVRRLLAVRRCIVVGVVACCALAVRVVLLAVEPGVACCWP